MSRRFDLYAFEPRKLTSLFGHWVSTLERIETMSSLKLNGGV